MIIKVLNTLCLYNYYMRCMYTYIIDTKGVVSFVYLMFFHFIILIDYLLGMEQ